MLKIKILTFFVLLGWAFQYSHASSIYTFSGQINSVFDPTGGTNPYAGAGIYSGASVSFSIFLDAGANGSRTSSTGVVTYYPFYEHFGAITSQDQWTRYAALISSNIDVNNPSGGFSNYFYDHAYSSYNSGSNYAGYIVVGSSLLISKSADYGDTSAFVENWKQGDSVLFRFALNNGTGSISFSGNLTLSNVSNPLPSLTGMSVPVPGAFSLLSSALTFLLWFRKRSAQAINAVSN